MTLGDSQPPSAVDPAAADPSVCGDLSRTLVGHIARVEIEMLEEPHIVVCIDAASGVTTYTGPFPNAFEALAEVHACEDAQQAGSGAGRSGVTCTVAPLFPA